MQIKFCEHNPGKGAALRRLEEDFPGQEVTVQKCIKQCSVCREMPMATVDGERVTAPDGARLFEKIAQRVRQQPA